MRSHLSWPLLCLWGWWQWGWRSWEEAWGKVLSATCWILKWLKSGLQSWLESVVLLFWISSFSSLGTSQLFIQPQAKHSDDPAYNNLNVTRSEYSIVFRPKDDPTNGTSLLPSQALRLSFAVSWCQPSTRHAADLICDASLRSLAFGRFIARLISWLSVCFIVLRLVYFIDYADRGESSGLWALKWPFPNDICTWNFGNPIVIKFSISTRLRQTYCVIEGSNLQVAQLISSFPFTEPLYVFLHLLTIICNSVKRRGSRCGEECGVLLAFYWLYKRRLWKSLL